MPRQQQQQPSLLTDMRTGFNVAILIADAHSACIRPLTRTGMGVRGMGTPGVLALFFIPVCASLAESPDLLTYWYGWIAMVIYRRLKAEPFQHPDYQGRVWMFHWCMKDEINARLMEAGMMPIIGGFLCQISEPIGLFVTAGFFSFGLRYVVDAAAHRRRKEAIRAARLEMEAMQRYAEEDVRGATVSAAVYPVFFNEARCRHERCFEVGRRDSRRRRPGRCQRRV